MPVHQLAVEASATAKHCALTFSTVWLMSATAPLYFGPAATDDIPIVMQSSAAASASGGQASSQPQPGSSIPDVIFGSPVDEDSPIGQQAPPMRWTDRTGLAGHEPRPVAGKSARVVPVKFVSVDSHTGCMLQLNACILVAMWSACQPNAVCFCMA